VFELPDYPLNSVKLSSMAADGSAERLDQQRIVDAALARVAEGGLAALTLRRLAADLGVQAPALYWHVRSKRALLDLMVVRIVEGIGSAEMRGPLPGQPWWDWLAERTRALYRGLLAHRDSALMAAGNRPTPASLPEIDRMIGCLADAGLPPPEGICAVLALSNYAIGWVLEQ